MDKNSFIAALKMNTFCVTNKYENKIILMQNNPLSKVNGLHISILEHSDKSIEIRISRFFSPNSSTYYDLNRAYKVILERM